MLLRILDRLEEILIATLIALETSNIFITVMPRYLVGIPLLYPILFYRSRILIRSLSFELPYTSIVARQIDFLSGFNSRERHEIYEPLWPAAEAKPEQLARRDCFWNGVVFYREKRWAEAYSEFQKARGPDEEEDAPLQLYLRRLEPLALNLAELPMKQA
jgi:hypothetical protein